MSSPPPQEAMNLEFNRRVLGTTPTRLGDAILAAKKATSDTNVRRSWILLGDPTMKLK